jgi:S-adenosylmethionine-diacylgycerolhomoserine-N-methlytransferase
MIPPWEQALDRAMAAVLPGGTLHIVDFGGQEHLPRVFRSGLRAWLNQFHVTPRDGLAEALSQAAASRGFRVSVGRPYRGYAVQAVAVRRPLA